MIRAHKPVVVLAALALCNSWATGQPMPSPDHAVPAAAVPVSHSAAPPSSPTILSTALVVAKTTGMTTSWREGEPPAQGRQLADLVRLLVRAGRSEEALRLLDTLSAPDGIKAPAFVPLVEAAIRSGDRERARAVAARVASLSEWPVASAC